MKKICFALVLCLSSMSFAAAEMFGLEVGFKWNSAEVEGSDSTKQTLGYQLCGTAVFSFNKPWSFKTGLFYTNRPVKYDLASGAEGEANFTYFDVPAQLMYLFEDYAGVYVGPSLSLNLSKECKPSGCRLSETQSMVLPITVGALFKFAPGMGANIFFETISGKLAKDITNSRAVGANFFLAFD